MTYRSKAIVAATLGVSIIGATLLVMRACDMRSGNIDWVALQKLRETHYVLAMTTSASRRARLFAVIDATRGKLVARARVSHARPLLAGLAGGAVWLFSGSKLFALDLTSLDERYKPDDLARRVHEANPNIDVVGRPSFVVALGKLHVTGRDGKGYTIDPTTFKARRSPRDKLARQTARTTSSLRGEVRARVDGVGLALDGQLRRRLVVSRGASAATSMPSRPAENPPGGDKRAVLLQAVFAPGNRYGAVNVFGRGAERAVLVVHYASATKGAPWRVSALRFDGTLRWTFRAETLAKRIATRQLVALWLVDKTVVGVARRDGGSAFVRDTPNAVFSLDDASGALRWALPF
ncbi:MAG: hypothetical protein KC503_01065 [Myxococcales bacterium]|nr:hypothetical protein [Myxococcales bacterium]